MFRRKFNFFHYSAVHRKNVLIVKIDFEFAVEISVLEYREL